MTSIVPEVGHAALLVALLLSVFGTGAAARAAASANPAWLGSARQAAWAQFLLVTLAGLALEYLLVTGDFGVRYVANTSVSTARSATRSPACGGRSRGRSSSGSGSRRSFSCWSRAGRRPSGAS